MILERRHVAELRCVGVSARSHRVKRVDDVDTITWMHAAALNNITSKRIQRRCVVRSVDALRCGTLYSLTLAILIPPFYR